MEEESEAMRQMDPRELDRPRVIGSTQRRKRRVARLSGKSVAAPTAQEAAEEEATECARRELVYREQVLPDEGGWVITSTAVSTGGKPTTRGALEGDTDTDADDAARNVMAKVGEEENKRRDEIEVAAATAAAASGAIKNTTAHARRARSVATNYHPPCTVGAAVRRLTAGHRWEDQHRLWAPEQPAMVFSATQQGGVEVSLTGVVALGNERFSLHNDSGSLGAAANHIRRPQTAHLRTGRRSLTAVTAATSDPPSIAAGCAGSLRSPVDYDGVDAQLRNVPSHAALTRAPRRSTSTHACARSTSTDPSLRCVQQRPMTASAASRRPTPMCGEATPPPKTGTEFTGAVGVGAAPTSVAATAAVVTSVRSIRSITGDRKRNTTKLKTGEGRASASVKSSKGINVHVEEDSNRNNAGDSSGSQVELLGDEQSRASSETLIDAFKSVGGWGDSSGRQGGEERSEEDGSWSPPEPSSPRPHPQSRHTNRPSVQHNPTSGGGLFCVHGRQIIQSSNM